MPTDSVRVSYGVPRAWCPQGEYGPRFWVVPEFRVWNDPETGMKMGSWRWVYDDTKEPVKKRDRRRAMPAETDATRDSSHKRLKSGKCRREGRYIPTRWVNIHPIEGGTRVASSSHLVTEYPRPLDQITALLNEEGLTGEFFCIWRDCCGQEQQKSTVVRATLNNITVEEVR